MPIIQETWKTVGVRGENIRQMLRPIAGQSGGPAWQPGSIRREYIIGTHDGSPPQSDYRAWRFATILPNFRAMYFERWIQSDGEFLYLDRAYLSIFKKDFSVQDGENEFLCLHCDPNEPDSAAHAIYKKGPHLHITAVKEEPFPHAHIALNRGHLDEALSSMASLSKAMNLAILMLKEEILDALK